MIISRITSGLGNQMFQYAIGRSLSLQHQTSLKLDIMNFDKKQYRKFGLTNFNLNIEYASSNEINSFKGHLIDFFKPYHKKKNIKERYTHYDPTIKNLIKDDLYLGGYWQSDKYFKDFEVEIRKDLAFKSSIITNVSDQQKLIQNSNSVSLHIRRGDYHSHPIIAKSHGVLSLEYYYNAIKHLKETDHSLIFFIFSDDMHWVKNNLKLKENVHFVEGNTEIEDLFLMSICKNNIIANSTFSWWGAWLNSNKEKIVIMPEFWFKDKPYNKSDIAPSQWLRMK